MLLEDEARNNLILGLGSTLIEEPGRYSAFELWIVEEPGRPVAAGLQTPPWNLAVSGPAPSGALVSLARAIHEEGVILPGVTGATPEVDAFAEEWARIAGVPCRVAMEQGIYELSRVRPLDETRGTARDAAPEDRILLMEWISAFVREADPGRPSDPGRIVDERLEGSGSGLVLWEDGRPVSLAGYGGLTPNGIRIGPVYTPPEYRGRGYASALVAALSRRLLDEGRTFCFLYTDLTNPTSNRIYQRIGYERVCDSRVYRFEN